MIDDLPRYNTLIVGAGNIGAFYHTPSSTDVVTHAQAYCKHPDKFQLVGFVDTDVMKAKKAAAKWDTNAFDSLQNAFDKYPIDIVSVAVPDEYHHIVMSELLKYDVKLIFLEKPIADSKQNARMIMHQYLPVETPVLVNYSRRFTKEFQVLKNRIQSGEFGDFLNGTGYYGKGLIHNGSHLIDLLFYLFNNVTVDNQYIGSIYDYYENDPSISATLKINNKPFLLQAINCQLYEIFEIDLFYEKKRITITDLGFVLKEYDVLPSPYFKGYVNLVESITRKTTLGQALDNAVINIYEHLTMHKGIICSLEDAYRSFELCHKIMEGYKDEKNTAIF
ncbi:hypothetical protein BHU72_05230 [Desulfuribacillus stibiiarsenatis]|uniref:Gfo/Idh/MocA-like oxidoreductase N-terminal domain-containing protein n=1 Tax=Desulfuribacillus stibiiarsenatis TaxID=1390249 RepID=A0A1E5L5T4_9FIRM|nr:Gfo/Idh/MocA family oxidoreductase [Desulfuribacillus stibiiarsenatis]OEH85490.1 hypothetical protein BHU72_05230 [Desulfuribacillus stibiiarsenatis]